MNDIYTDVNSELNTLPPDANQTAASNEGNPIEELIALRTTQEGWFANEYKKSNESLYGLLGKCLGICQRMHKKPPQVAAFRAECVRLNLTFRKDTPLLNRVVRYVFGGTKDNKRVSGYARALAHAHTAGADPMQLHTWIAGQGGVEEVRARQSGRMSAAQRAEAGKAKGIAAAQGLGAFETVSVGGFTLKDAATPYIVVLARVMPSGAIELLAPITDESVIDRALAAYGAKSTIDVATSARVTQVTLTNDSVFNAL